jgi:hypothetical protein
MKNRIEFAFGQHRFDRFLVRQAGILYVFRQRDLDVVFDFSDPLDAVQRHAVFMLQDAAHPQDGGGHHRLDADPAAAQVSGPCDALRGVDEHEAMPKPAMQENRDGPKRHAVIARGEIGRARYRRDIEFPLVQETPMPRG